jgi:hypothetical protein
MAIKLIRGFVRSAGSLLLATGSAKVISSAGMGRIMQLTDPLLQIPFAHLLLVIGVVEMLIGLICVFGKQLAVQTLLVAWLGTSFVVYRVALCG